MAGQSGAPLVAVHLPRPAAADAISAAWDHGEAVLVLDPAAPATTIAGLIERFAPTAVLDERGRRDHPGTAAGDGAAGVVVTSGTTGEPKGAELTVAGLEAIGAAFAAELGGGPSDLALVCLPLHHVAGLAILARARVSGTPVLVHPAFDLERVARAPRDEGVTTVSLVPTMLRRLLDAGAPLHEYRRVIVGGAPTPPDVRARAEAIGAPVIDTYGLSETWGGVVLDGRPIPGVEIRLDGKDEIEMRGPMIMRGYRDAPDATAAAFSEDGWFRTRDVGVIEDGIVRVVDRARDLVITGGINVSPTAVETVLSTHPDVADVCVAGAPDAEWGERVVAYVVPTDASRPPTLDDLRAFSRDRLSAAQLPKQLVLLDAIPRTPGGKALRRELRAPDMTAR